jgi:hypothetical protein
LRIRLGKSIKKTGDKILFVGCHKLNQRHFPTLTSPLSQGFKMDRAASSGIERDRAASNGQARRDHFLIGADVTALGILKMVLGDLVRQPLR